MFLGAVSGLEWTRGEALLEERIPGAVAQAIGDADTFFGIELPAGRVDLRRRTGGQARLARALGRRERDAAHVGGGRRALRSALPQVDECTIDGVGHLLQIQRPEPVARGMAEFLGRHLMSGDGLRAVSVPHRAVVRVGQATPSAL